MDCKTNTALRKRNKSTKRCPEKNTTDKEECFGIYSRNVCLVEIMEALNISNYQREKF